MVMADKILTCDVAILGAGPGGYTAAFRAADLGKHVILIEKEERLGGVCLNIGCIPSKTYLHAVKVIDDALDLSDKGVVFQKPTIDLPVLRSWKNKVVSRLTTGLAALAKQRKVDVIRGVGQFVSPQEIKVDTSDGVVTIRFQSAIIAAGSSPRKLDFLPQDTRILDSTSALELPISSGRLLIMGAGIIGLEMATVYSQLGLEVTLADIAPQIIPGADKDLIMPIQRRLQKHCQYWLESNIKAVEPKADGLYVAVERNQTQETQRFDAVLCAVGRVPNGDLIGAEKAGIFVDERGFIRVDKQQRTNVPPIFAIGDVVGNPMLAHKAVYEGHIAAEVIAGLPSAFHAKCIPSVAYTDPEIAWVGLTETEANTKGIPYKKAVFPWLACGRALSINRSEGLTKLLCDAEGKIIGAGIVGVNVGEMIGELALAIERGCTAKEIAETIHPHPTLSETIMMAAEVFEGTVTDLPQKKA